MVAGVARSNDFPLSSTTSDFSEYAHFSTVVDTAAGSLPRSCPGSGPRSGRARWPPRSSPARCWPARISRSRARRGRRPGAAAPKRRAGGSKRAPRGSVPRFVEQALRDHPGSTVQEILGLASTDAERLIRLSSIRVELGNGRKQGKYESRGRRWSLAASASAAAGEDGTSGAPPEVEPERDDAASASAGEPAMQDPPSPESEADGNENRGRLGLTC